jgi:hypothetical protein
MALDFTKRGALNNQQQAAAKDLPKSQIWINLGFTAEGAGAEGEDVFVSLPYGLPLDSMEHVNTKSKNADYSALQHARNDLLDQVKEASATLQPGESMLVTLEIQIRRIEEEVEEAPVANSKFARQLNLVG